MHVQMHKVHTCNIHVHDIHTHIRTRIHVSRRIHVTYLYTHVHVYSHVYILVTCAALDFLECNDFNEVREIRKEVLRAEAEIGEKIERKTWQRKQLLKRNLT